MKYNTSLVRDETGKPAYLADIKALADDKLDEVKKSDGLADGDRLCRHDKTLSEDAGRTGGSAAGWRIRPGEPDD
jgi:hypothetical protein